MDLEASYTPPALPDVLAPTTRSTYNRDRQPTLVTRPDGQTLSFAYESGGRLSTLTLPTGLFRYAYSASTGQVSTVTAPGGGTLSYTYDGFLLTGERWGGPAGAIAGQVGWTYDTDFRVTTERVNGADPVSFSYDPDSLVTQAGALGLTRDAQTGFVTGTTLGSVTDTRSYSTFGELASYQAAAAATTLLDVQYTRDRLGRITEKTETVEGVTTVHGYRYDVAGRLEVVTRDGVEVARYAYDSNSNRTSRTTPSGTATGTSDAQDRLLSYGGATYTYTANGELATKTDATGATGYQYDVLGNLLAVTLPDGTRLDYVIDGRNRRVGKKVNGVLAQAFLYRDALKPVAELDGAGNVVARFVYGSSLVVPDHVVKGGVTYRVISDHLGSPRLVVDTATGAIVQRVDYDEFGQVTLDTNPGFQPFGFAGGLYDGDTRLSRFGARDYDSQTGRWTGKDPIRFDGNGSNLYGYVLNDPVNGIDPWGLFGTYAGGVARVTAPAASVELATRVVVGPDRGGDEVGLVVPGDGATILAGGAAVGRGWETGFFLGDVEDFLHSTSVNIDTCFGGLTVLLDEEGRFLGGGLGGPTLAGPFGWSIVGPKVPSVAGGYPVEIFRVKPGQRLERPLFDLMQ